MKRFSLLLVAVLMTASLSFSQQVTILHTSDSHSHLTESGVKDINGYPTQGGISRLAYQVGIIKTTNPGALFFHSGDYSVGDLMFNFGGVPELQILKGAGCDAMAVGNHEFDLGPEVLYNALTAAFAPPAGGFPLLSANCDMTAMPELGTFIMPYTIRTVNGVKIGIFGLTIPDPLIRSYPVVITEDIDVKAYETVTYLREIEEADVVICLSHLGFNLDYMLASGMPGIDFILGGHDHAILQQEVTGPNNWVTRIYHAGEYYQKLGKLSFTFNNGVQNVNYELINIQAPLPTVPAIDGIVNGLKDQINTSFGFDVYMPGPVAVNHLSKNVNPEAPFKDTPLGNLVTDSYRGLTGTQIGITVQGLISEDVFQGGISLNDAFRAVGYGLKLVTFKLYGAELTGAMEFALANASQYVDYYPQVSGMTFKFNSNRPDYKKIVPGSIRVNGALLKPGGDYTITCNEGLYGILASMGITGRDEVMRPEYEFETLMGTIMALGSVNYTSEGRIKDAKYLPESDNNTNGINNIDYKLYDNFPNPFNPVTNIKFTVAQNSPVNVSIYDITGRLIRNLVNEVKEPGTYTIQWNASGLSSGVYFCRMMSGNFNSVKKLVLAK
jgi:5'-nucleotidase / UDP-sugar diphosphatase